MMQRVELILHLLRGASRPMGSVVAGGRVGMGELRQPNRQIGGAERRRMLRNGRMRRLLIVRVLLLMRKCVTRRGRRIEIAAAAAAAAHPTGRTRARARARTAAVEHIHRLDVERKQSAQQRRSHLLGGRRGIGALGGERVLELGNLAQQLAGGANTETEWK